MIEPGDRSGARAGEVTSRLAEVRARVAAAAAAAAAADADAGVDAATRGAGVTLVAVSKGHEAASIRAAYDAGQRDFGESYAQELVAKADALADLPDLRWHFVGHLQTNKARLVAPCAHVVHSVDGPALARELGRRVERAGRARLPVLVEVNVGGEPQKHGVAPQDLEEVIAAVRAERGLVLRGLMTIPPASDRALARRVFETLALLRNIHGGRASLPDLSMGMSEDLEEAILAGATIVRVGTAIFGERR